MRGLPVAWRRHRVFGVPAIAIAALLVPLIAVGAVAGWWLEREPGVPVPEGEVVVKEGRWNGVPWAVTTFLAVDGLCFGLTRGGRTSDDRSGGGLACGAPLRGVAELEQTSPALHWVTYLEAAPETDFPGWIVGPTAPEVTQVDVVLQTGETIAARTFAAPDELGLNVNFYVEQLPCGGDVTVLVPKDESGRTLERWELPMLGPPPRADACGDGSTARPSSRPEVS